MKSGSRMSKIDQSTTKWTKLAYQCYLLKGNCSQCDIPSLSLISPCRVKDLVPQILETHGKPVKVHSKGRTVVVGEKQIGPQCEPETIMFKKPHHQAVLDQVMKNPGITSLEIQKRLGLAKYAVHDALEISFKLGIIQKNTLQMGSIRYKQWFYIGNHQLT